MLAVCGATHLETAHCENQVHSCLGPHAPYHRAVQHDGYVLRGAWKGERRRAGNHASACERSADGAGFLAAVLSNVHHQLARSRQVV